MKISIALRIILYRRVDFPLPHRAKPLEARAKRLVVIIIIKPRYLGGFRLFYFLDLSIGTVLSYFLP